MSRPISFLIALSLVAVGLALPISALATTIHVPGDSTTIQAGINGASAGDTVLVACDTYYEHDIVMKSGVCLRSETGLPDCVTIDAESLGKVFYCEEVDSTASIEGFTITGGLATGTYPYYAGGGLYCFNSSLKLTNCIFSDNIAEDHGGGMICWGPSSPSISNCTFSSNSATFGGGVASFTSSMITDCIIFGNSASNDGGGVFYGMWSEFPPTLTNCTFFDNTASNGGAIYCDASYPMITGCTIFGDSATFGGGIYCDESSPTITSCSLFVNFATYGGGMYCNESSPTLTSSTFSDNSSTFGGGGMRCVSNSSADLDSCRFSGNTASNGGGVCCVSSSPTFSNCIFSGNSSYADYPEGGGGIFCAGGSPILTNCTFSDNFSNSGGGIHCSSSSATISGCTIYGNTAFSGGGIICFFLFPTITGCTISGNGASIGGGISFIHYLATAVEETLTLENTIIAFSTQGEAVHCDGPTNTMVICCDVYENASGDWVECIAGQGSINDNFSADPLFCDPDNDDYHIDEDSPCAPDNSPSDCGLIGALSVGCGISPSAITDLSVSVAGDTFATLIWTAPGDDGDQGTASDYDLRYSTTSVGSDTAGWWSAADTIANEPLPSEAGSLDSCTITGLLSDTTYYFVIRTADEGPNWSSFSNVAFVRTVGVSQESDATGLPIFFCLPENYPNPFNPITQIKYALPKDCQVRLEIYNILGQKVASLVDGEQKAGYKTARWDATSFSSGIYFYRLQAGDFVQTRKMVLIR